jgi:predicted TIM-barrel fold metal-dependent hydrolase
MLGRYYTSAFGTFLSAAAIGNEYRAAGIEGGVVYHATAREQDPMHGNEALMREVEGYPALEPAWVVTPHTTEEAPAPQVLARALKARGVRLVRIFCGRDAYSPTLDSFLFGELLEMLEHHCVPVMVEFDSSEYGGGGFDNIVWRDLEAVCRSFPELRLILASPKSTGLGRFFFRLMEIHDRFALETSGFQLFGGLETVVRRFGAHRLLFGTRLPHFDASLHMVAIQYAELEERDKRMIAGDNLRSLLAEVAL